MVNALISDTKDKNKNTSAPLSNFLPHAGQYSSPNSSSSFRTPSNFQTRHRYNFQQERQSEPIPEDGKQRIGYVLHCKFTGNNTILTLTSQFYRVGKLAEKLTDADKYLDKVRPREDVLINMTAGLVGFRNTKQGEYEAGFQTTKRLFELMKEREYLDKPIEIIFSNFGKGREAFINALNGSEGTHVRPNVKRVTDGTKIKIGGVRPPRARRV